MLQLFNFIKMPLSNPKLLLSVLLNTFYSITGNNVELFHFVNCIYTERIIVYFGTYNLRILFILNRIQVLVSK